jgi:hypothetical protein
MISAEAYCSNVQDLGEVFLDGLRVDSRRLDMRREYALRFVRRYNGGMTGTAAPARTTTSTDFQGSIIGTSASGLMTMTTEFGVDRPQTDGTPRLRGGTGADKYGWLGGKRRDPDALAGLTLGPFLQVDPAPGGSCNDYDYICQDALNQTDLNGLCCSIPNPVHLVVKAASYAVHHPGDALAVTGLGAWVAVA